MAGIHKLIDGNGVPFRVFVYAPGNAKRSNVRVVILPGANCTAERYRWLALPSNGHARDTLTFSVGHSLDGVVIGGASMQTEVMGFTLPWRQNDTRLFRPNGLPVLFIAGEHDGLVPPYQVSATVARYDPPTALVVQRGANHFGWTGGAGELDRHDLDGAATLSPGDQKAATLRLTNAFFSAIAAREPGGLAGKLRRACAKGDTIDVRQAN